MSITHDIFREDDGECSDLRNRRQSHRVSGLLKLSRIRTAALDSVDTDPLDMLMAGIAMASAKRQIHMRT